MAAATTDRTPRQPGLAHIDTNVAEGNNDVQATEPAASSSSLPDEVLLSTRDALSPPRSRSRSAIRLFKLLSPTLTLENSGSVARDHLASERTWLAYVRTSLAIASTGVALVQLFTISSSSDSEVDSGKSTDLGHTIQRFARPLGATTVLLGLGVLAIGVQRYFKIQKAMTEGQFPVARKTVIFITAVLAALVAVVFAVLVSVPRRED